MLRGLTFAVALALGTVTVPVHALGLGDIKAQSALNQDFNADIDLLSVVAGELDAVRVELADQKEFDKAGVERPYFLTLLKFSPQRLESGETVIRVSSDFPIREPFLDFLVEVNWPRGRLIREYTVLLDPPVTTGRRAPRVKAAAVKPAKPPAEARAAAPTPTPSAAGGEYGPVAANETLWSIAKQLRPRGASMHQMMIALLEGSPGAFIDGDINRLRKGAILRVPPSEQILSISRQQARELYVQAQERWLARETERLREAQVQEAPETADVAPEPELDATADEEAELRIATARPEGEGEAGAGEDRGDEDVDQLKEKLLLARENTESTRLESESLRSEIEDMQKRLADMQRLLSLKDEQLAQLQASVGEEVPVVAEEITLPQVPMQEEVPADVDAIADEVAPLAESFEAVDQLELPSEQPAESGLDADLEPEIVTELETEAEILLEEGLEEEVALELDLEPDAAIDLASGLDSVTDQEVLAETLDLPAGEAPETTSLDDEMVPEGDLIIQPETVITPMPDTEQAEPVIESDLAPGEEPEAAPEEAATAAPAPVAQPMSDDSLAMLEEFGLPAAKLRELLQDRNLLYIGAGALGLLVLLLLLLMLRRRNPDEVDEIPPPIAPEKPETPPAKDLPQAAEAAMASSIAAAAATTAVAEDGETDDLLRDSSFPPAPEGLETINADVDAVAEADVYIAYGRYAQAEELLKEAMVRAPEQLVLKNKLLEVYYATHNKNQYNALAEGIVTAGQEKQDPEAWDRICDMGRELDAGNPLYDGTQRAAAATLDTDVDAEGGTNPLDSSLTEDLVDSTLNDIQTEEKLLADTVDEPLLDIEDLEQIDDIEALDDASLSLDELESLELDMSGQGKTDTQKEEDFGLSGLADDSLESLELPPLDRESGLASEAAQDESELKLELDELSSLSALEGDSVQLTDQARAAEPDADGLESVLDKPIPLDEAFDQEIDSDVEALDIDSMGEEFADAGAVGTKLELARAFVEMGDEEGARDILQEVVKEGSDNQRQEAERLLADIA